MFLLLRRDIIWILVTVLEEEEESIEHFFTELCKSFINNIRLLNLRSGPKFSNEKIVSLFELHVFVIIL